MIKIIRGSANTQVAKENLINRFGLSDAQAQAIVDMRLRALTGLEREKLEAEYADLMEKIRKYEAILADRSLLLRVIREEILAIAEKYGDDRKTSIGYDVYDISTEDLIPRENTVITMTKLGYIKRMTVDNFRSHNRDGRGIKGMQTPVINRLCYISKIFYPFFCILHFPNHIILKKAFFFIEVIIEKRFFF